MTVGCVLFWVRMIHVCDIVSHCIYVWEGFISKLYNPYICGFLTFGIILNLKFTHMILIFMRANDVCFETPMMTASDDCDMVMTSIYSLWWFCVSKCVGTMTKSWHHLIIMMATYYDVCNESETEWWRDVMGAMTAWDACFHWGPRAS